MRSAAMLLFLAGFICLAQSKAPVFEVASIRPGQPGRESIETGPASLTIRNTRLSASIRWAYGVQDVQVIGPDWLNPTWFDIFAKSSSQVSVAQLREMLQALLADRFQLEAHHDSKEMTALVFTVSKAGHKLQPVDTEGSPSFQTGKLNLTGRGATMRQLVDFISNEVHVPVIDHTGLTGRYNYFLDIDPYWTEESRKVSNGGPPPDANAIVAAAMQKELGIKVDSRKVPVEVIVVDHMEKTPTEN